MSSFSGISEINSVKNCTTYIVMSVVGSNFQLHNNVEICDWSWNCWIYFCEILMSLNCVHVSFVSNQHFVKCLAKWFIDATCNVLSVAESTSLFCYYQQYTTYIYNISENVSDILRWVANIHVVVKNISSRFFSNSEAIALELLRNIEEIFLF